MTVFKLESCNKITSPLDRFFVILFKTVSEDRDVVSNDRTFQPIDCNPVIFNAFLILGLLFWVLLNYELSLGYRLTFYIRRFLIHPLFLLILLPAFYYQKLKMRKAK